MADGERLDFAEQLAALRKRTLRLVPTQRWDDLLGQAHNRAFTIAGATQADLLKDFADAVEQAIKSGAGIDEFRKDFDRIVAKYGWSYKGERNWRTRVIYQTNVQTSYAAGRWAQLNDPDLLKIKPFWMYRHSDSVLYPRPLHVSWNRLVLRHDHPFWRTHYPPNGWGCRCYVVALTEKEAKRLGLIFDAPDDGLIDGRPAGIDKGWDYAPGADVPAEIQALIDDKAKTLTAALAKQVRATRTKSRMIDGEMELDDLLKIGESELKILRRNAGIRGKGPYTDAQAIALREALLASVNLRRGTGNVEVNLESTNAAAEKTLRLAALRYPDLWVETANKKRILLSLEARGGSYKPRLAKMQVRAVFDSAVHEYAHHLQAMMPGLDRWFQQLHFRRTRGEPIVRIEGGGEGRRDQYVFTYQGREYDGNPAEVMTVIYQILLGGSENANTDRLRRMLAEDAQSLALGIALLLRWSP